MKTTKPCCERCETEFTPPLSNVCSDWECPCHQEATATPETKNHENWTGQASIRPEMAKNGHIPAQDWVKKFDALFAIYGDEPQLIKQFAGKMFDFISKEIAAAREEGKREGYQEEASKCHEHAEQAFEKGRRAMREEILQIVDDRHRIIAARTTNAGRLAALADLRAIITTKQ